MECQEIARVLGLSCPAKAVDAVAIAVEASEQDGDARWLRKTNGAAPFDHEGMPDVR